MAVDLSLTNTYRWDVDVSTLRPVSGSMIVECDDEEMLKIGDTGLILGFYEDNRNNAHWFGRVTAKADDVPLDIGDQVWFSYLSAKGMDRIISHNRMYLFLKYRDVILRNNGSIEMLNGNILSVDLPPKKHPTLEYYETDTYYTEVRHAPKDSAYKKGDVVHYWLEQVYELEGQRKLLKENYRVLKEENIISYLDNEQERINRGMVLVKLYDEQLELESGIKLVNPIHKRSLRKGVVVESSCDIKEGMEVLVKESRGYTLNDMLLFNERDVILLSEDRLHTKGYFMVKLQTEPIETKSNLLLNVVKPTNKDAIVKAMVLDNSTEYDCEYIYVKESLGTRYGEYLIVKDKYVEAVC